MSFWKTIGGLLGSGLGADLAERGYEKLESVGTKGYKGLTGLDPNTGKVLVDPVTGKPTGLAQQLDERLKLQPYTVTTTTGSDFGMMERPETTLEDGTVVPRQMEYLLNLSGDEKTLQDTQRGYAESLFSAANVDPASRELDIYTRMLDATAAERARKRLDLEERLKNQGRLGVRTAMFGGTPEQFALEKAEEEANLNAYLAAMQYAGEEQQRQAQLGTGMLASSYIPQTQLLAALEPGMTTAERRRAAMSEQAQSYGETYASGLEALLSASKGQADIVAGLGSSIAEVSLGSLFS